LNDCLRFAVGGISQIAVSGPNGSNRIRSRSLDMNQELFNSPARNTNKKMLRPARIKIDWS